MTSRVLIVQRIVPHYRVPFFQRLAQSDRASYRFAYGEHRAGTALESVMHPDAMETVRLRNSYVTVAGRELVVYQAGLRELVRSGAYDVVIAEFNPRIMSNVLAWAESRRAGVKFVWWGHGMGPRAGAIAMRMRVMLARAADAVIFYDDVRAEQFVSAGLARERAFVAPNSVDVGAAVIPTNAIARDGRHRVLYVGRLVAEKKVELLLEAFAALRRRGVSGSVLTIVGDGPERALLERTAQTLGIAHDVEFVGAVYDADALAALFNSAWASVSPGPIGLAAIHSLSHGVPVVLADAEPHGPEASALVNGYNAVVFSAGQADALADALAALAADGARWSEMANAARTTAEQQYGLGRMVDAFERAVEYVVGRRAA